VTHYYGGGDTGPKISVQRASKAVRSAERPTLPEKLVAMAEAEYERQGYGQTAKRLRERGGLSYGEVMALLADAVERYAPPEALRSKSLEVPA
jgi:hypothetical protein